MKNIFWFFENNIWSIRCSYNLWLHGPYGLAKVIERIPFRYLVKFLRKYGATVGNDCRFERGLNLHRALGKKPFENLIIGNGVYLGHNTLIDLTEKVEIKDKVIVASRCQIWTHSSFYENNLTYKENKGPVLIKQQAIVYSNAVISAGMTIGEFAKVGACALVNRSVPDNTFVKGVPAK
jgi:acetyltransferase-like isoleucine patch superfamily enzyme